MRVSGVIYIYCADDSVPGFMPCFALAEDGTCLGSHMCSTEEFARKDLGDLNHTPDDRANDYAAHYPDGYQLEFVPASLVETHPGLQRALQENHRQDDLGVDGLGALPDVRLAYETWMSDRSRKEIERTDAAERLQRKAIADVNRVGAARVFGVRHCSEDQWAEIYGGQWTDAGYRVQPCSSGDAYNILPISVEPQE